MKKVTLYIALVISLITYLFWTYLPKGTFYIGNAMYIVLLTAYIYFFTKKKFIKFILFAFAINNLVDELFFDNTKLSLNELLFPVIIIIIWKLCHKNISKS